MRRSAVALLALLAFPSSAAATPVLVMSRSGHAGRVNDPYLSGADVTPAPAGGPATPQALPGSPTELRGARRPARQRRKPSKPQPTVGSELARLARSGSISKTTYAKDLGIYNRALSTERHLTGTRRAELSAVTETVHGFAVRHLLTPSRLAVVFATVDRNRQWWSSGSLLTPYARVEFAGSQLVWEYYPGQGIQLQVLGTFGRANGLYESGPSGYGAMQQLLAEMIPLAASRAGGLAWEYYFAFDGGSPPWTSAMSQATGLEALAQAYKATKNPYYLQVAASALPLFRATPPVGVGIATRLGRRYVQYTFTPQTSIINAFLQTVIGLDVYARVSHNATAATLFSEGNAEAQAELPSFDTGAWSLYQPGVEDDLSYHELVTGFLTHLCSLTRVPVYCATAQHFTADLKTPPVIQQLTTRGARKRRPFTIRFRLSKVSHVGITIIQGSQTRFLTSASFPYGVGGFAIPGLRAGTYAVRLAATDLAGNFASTTGSLTVPR